MMSVDIEKCCCGMNLQRFIFTYNLISLSLINNKKCLNRGLYKY
jgi:hypothetical protein